MSRRYVEALMFLLNFPGESEEKQHAMGPHGASRAASSLIGALHRHARYDARSSRAHRHFTLTGVNE